MWRQENTGDDLGQPLGRRDAEGSKGRSLPGYSLARLSGGASEVLGRAAWAPVLHLLLGHSESPAWPPSHSDNRKVNTPPPPGPGSGQRGSGAASGAPPGWDSPPGFIYTLAGGIAWLCPDPSCWARGPLGDNGEERGRGSSGHLQTQALGWGKLQTFSPREATSLNPYPPSPPSLGHLESRPSLSAML